MSISMSMSMQYNTIARYKTNSQINNISQLFLILNWRMFIEEGLLSCIRSIKEKHRKNEEFQRIANKQANSKEELESKVRAMTIAFESIAEQNRDLSKMQQRFVDLLNDKDKQVDLKQLENKKYRQQLLEAMQKNQQLTKYCRELANEYNILLNCMKDGEETALCRQRSAHSKLVNMQNQVSHLRGNILGIKSDNYSNLENEKAKKMRNNFSAQRLSIENNRNRKRSESKGSSKKKQSKNSHQVTQYSTKSKKSIVHMMA